MKTYMWIDDVEANRPPPSITARWFAATDTGRLFLDTGSAWVPMNFADALDTMPETTTFGPGGLITTVYGAPVNTTVTTTFNPDGSIVESFGSPISKTLTTTFGADGSINQAVS